ncbi:hypothetical protein BH11PSE5_BH11PSE5_30100 [soil metagenome]
MDGITKVLAAILLFGVFVAAIKAALVLLILAGLIFRTKETAGLLILMGSVHLIATYPLIALSVAGVVGLTIGYRAIFRPA